MAADGISYISDIRRHKISNKTNQSRYLACSNLNFLKEEIK
jgi:hypothetical protein